MQKGFPYLALLSVIAGLGFIAAFALDIRYAILALMVVFILAPMVLLFLYFFYALGKFYRFNIVYHNLSLTEEGLDIVLYFPEKNPDKEKRETDIVDFEHCRKSEINVAYKELAKCEMHGRGIVFFLGNQLCGFIWLPVNAFRYADDFNETVNRILGRMSCES